MSETKKDPRIEVVAKHLEGHIAPGERFYVEGGAAGVSVEHAEKGKGTSVLKRSHPELYGRLLAVNEALEKAGSFVNKVLWLGGLVLVVLIATGWIDGLFGFEVEKLRSWWVYVLIAGVTLFVTSMVGNLSEAIAFVGKKESVQRAANDAGFSATALLSAIEGDEDLDEVAPRLKREVSKSGRNW